MKTKITDRLLEKELEAWLSEAQLNVFASVSLRQGIQNDDGTWSRITPDHISRTAWLLRDRFTKAFVGKRKQLPFLVFAEGDGAIKRYHLHIMTFVPNDKCLREFTDKFRFHALKLDWVYNEIDIKPIQPRTERKVLKYSLKEGINAFIPEASCVPFKN